MMKQECEKEASDSQMTDAILSASQTSAALSAQQAYQQVLQQTTGAGNLTPQLQFFQAPSNSGAASLSLPWGMMPHYQMMVLPQGVPQSLFASNVLTLQDNHILVAPLGDGNNGQATDDALIQAAAAEGIVRQVKDSDKRPMAQARSSATAGVAGDAAGGNMMMVGQQVVADGMAFNAHLANTSVENILGRHRQVQSEASKPDTPKPPKKPLTPYMLFSKAIWPQVKAANSHLSSVCEIGAVVGALWRELNPNEKQRYNELFTKDKERYDTELRLYLSTTGLHASDLAKPKPKRKDIRDKSSRPAPSALNASNQHLVQSMMGVPAAGVDVQRQNAAAATAAAVAALPNLAQDWTGQAVQQFAANQQILAQMGLAGQTLYANSDGSISVDSGLGSLVAFHPQSLQVVPGTSGTIVSGAGGQIAAIYSDQQHGGLVQSSSSKLDVVTSLSDDPTRAWPQSQSNLVLYQATPADQAKTDPHRSLAKVKTAGDVAMNGPMSQDHPKQQYYAVDQHGQVVKCGDDDSGRKNQLEAELQHLRSALSEKNNEVQGLNLKLEEAYRIIDRYKQQFSEMAAAGSQPTSQPAAGGSSDDGATDGSTTATTVGNASG